MPTVKPPRSPAPPSTPVTIDEFALAARDFVQRAVGLELDGSVESLAYVDHYLSKVGKVSGDVLALIAPAIGAYFGEVAIARLGGTWNTDGTPTEWTVVLEPAPIRFSPAGLVAEAMRAGEVEGYDGVISVPPELEGPLGEALAAGIPVEESYFYSLTGRLETIEHMVELLVELRRLADQP